MKLFIEGHNVKRGYAVSVQYSDSEISAMPASIVAEAPVRYYVNSSFAKRVVSRFNRRFANE
jgi:hypothetical protein